MEIRVKFSNLLCKAVPKGHSMDVDLFSVWKNPLRKIKIVLPRPVVFDGYSLPPHDFIFLNLLEDFYGAPI